MYEHGEQSKQLIKGLKCLHMASCRASANNIANKLTN